MKNIFLLLIVCFTTSIIKAQTFTTVDAFNYPKSIMYSDAGYYFKDTQGYFNQYIGIWQYNVGTLNILLRFERKTMIQSHNLGSYKTDVLVGGVRVIKNGVEVMNTLSTVNDTKNLYVEYFLFNGYRPANTPNCYNCTTPNQRLHIYYKEPDNDNNAFALMFFDMHIYYNAQNQPILRVVFTEEALQGKDPNYYDPMIETAPTKTTLHLPFGTYDFVKVP